MIPAGAKTPVPPSLSEETPMPLVNWTFDNLVFTDGLRTTFETNPNNWAFSRCDGQITITDEDGKIIDEPTDRGQSDLDLTIWGIGWLHTHFRDPADH